MRVRELTSRGAKRAGIKFCEKFGIDMLCRSLGISFEDTHTHTLSLLFSLLRRVYLL